MLVCAWFAFVLRSFRRPRYPTGGLGASNHRRSPKKRMQPQDHLLHDVSGRRTIRPTRSRESMSSSLCSWKESIDTS